MKITLLTKLRYRIRKRIVTGTLFSIHPSKLIYYVNNYDEINSFDIYSMLATNENVAINYYNSLCRENILKEVKKMRNNKYYFFMNAVL